MMIIEYECDPCFDAQEVFSEYVGIKFTIKSQKYRRITNVDVVCLIKYKADTQRKRYQV